MCKADGTSDGIRNYQARNFMRDDMRVGDLILFYHSNTNPPGVVGIAQVASKPYPDPTAFDKIQNITIQKVTSKIPVGYLSMGVTRLILYAWFRLRK